MCKPKYVFKFMYQADYGYFFRLGLYTTKCQLYISWLVFLKPCVVSFAFELMWLLWVLLYVRSGVRVKSCVRDPSLNPRVKHRSCFSIVGRCSVSSVQVIWNWCMWFLMSALVLLCILARTFQIWWRLTTKFQMTGGVWWDDNERKKLAFLFFTWILDMCYLAV